ncbi:MAG: aldose 1-epimerase [Hyphomicrobiales bacterium]
MTGVPNPLNDPTATRISAGNTEATFLPGHGMLGISLRYKGVEFLRRVDDLKTYAAKNRTAGIPFLFPWANRLDGFQYEAAGRGVTLSAHSSVLRYDDNGLPMHGMMWPHLAWDVVETSANALTASFDWLRPECLVVFPYPCRIGMTATVEDGSLTIETTLSPTSDIAVPISFGFHPYIGLPTEPRQEWQVSLPPMRHLVLDQRKIPTGASSRYPGFHAPLGEQAFDDGFALIGDQATLSVSGDGFTVMVELLENYPYTQVYAPEGQDYLAFEPMTAPTNALVSGEGLRLVEPGATFGAKFRFRIADDG